MQKIFENLQSILLKGTDSKMEPGFRLAIQVGNLYSLWGAVTIFIMALYIHYFSPYHTIVWVLLIQSLVSVGAFYLSVKQCFNCGRILFQLNGILAIIFGVDAVGPEYMAYYFVNISIPFIIFANNEKILSVFLGLLGTIVYLIQYHLGPGHLFHPVGTLPGSEIVAILGVSIFFLIMFTFFRYQMSLAQKEVEEQQAELVHKTSLIAMGKLTANIAHEINNPLQSLVLHNENLKKLMGSSALRDEKISSSLDGINKIITKIDSIIKSLKRLSTDGSIESLSKLLVMPVVQETLEVSMGKIDRLNVQVEVKIDSNLTIFSSGVFFSQALMNLISNAIDALEEQAEKWIRIESFVIGDKVQIKFTDSGPGIPPEMQDKIMEPFFTTKPSHKGTGLGLSISKRVVESSGGSLFLDKNSKHTCFVIEYPRA